MKPNVKSSLSKIANNLEKKEENTSNENDIDYVKNSSMDDYLSAMSDEEKEAEFNRLHQQYINTKMERKREVVRIKKQQFGTSSSDQSDEEQFENQVSVVKKSIQKTQSQDQTSKKRILLKGDSIKALVHLKKTICACQIIFLQKNFNFNESSIPYAKISKISILPVEKFQDQFHGKIKIGIKNQEQIMIVLKHFEDNSLSFSLLSVFLTLLAKILQSKGIKTDKQSDHKQKFPQQVTQKAKQYGKILKKSQYIGSWQQRSVVVKPEGLFSYKTLNTKPTMQIKTVDMKQICTFFEQFNNTIVFRVLYGNTKTDFGIPVCGQMRWVESLCGFMFAKK